MKKTILILSIIFSIGFQFCYAEYNQGISFLELLDCRYTKEDALTSLDKIIHDYPDFYEAYVMRIHIYYNCGEYNKALADVNKAMELQKRSNTLKQSMLYYMRADIYAGMCMYEKAVADLSTVYNMEKKNDDEEFLCSLFQKRAAMYDNIGESEKADADYLQMIKHDSFYQSGMTGLIRNSIKRGEYQEAISYANECENCNKINSEIYYLRMQAYDKTGKTELAIDDAINYIYGSDDILQIVDVISKNLNYSLSALNTAINKQDNENLIYMRGWVKSQKHDYVGAINDYNELEYIYKMISPFVYVSKSYCYYRIGEVQQAIREINRYLELCYNTDNEEAMLLKGVRAHYEYLVGDLESAMTNISEVLKYADLSTFHVLKGLCHEKEEDYMKAIDEYTISIAEDSNYIYSYYLRASVYEKTGMNDLAKADYDIIIANDTIAKIDSYRHYALHYYGKDDEAIEWLDKTIASDLLDNCLYFEKASFLSLIGKKEEAIEALRLSFKNGFRGFEEIDNDDNFDAIRNEPDFLNLINEYKMKPITGVKNYFEYELDGISSTTESDFVIGSDFDVVI